MFNSDGQPDLVTSDDTTRIAEHDGTYTFKVVFPYSSFNLINLYFSESDYLDLEQYAELKDNEYYRAVYNERVAEENVRFFLVSFSPICV